MDSIRTRSKSRQQSQSQEATNLSHRQHATKTESDICSAASSISTSLRASIADPLTRSLTGLKSKDFELLLAKQQKLRNLSDSLRDSLQERSSRMPKRRQVITHDVEATDSLSQALAATLVFAQAEAGTAVCISPSGLVLTCAHCVAQSEEELRRGGEKWLLFSTGNIVHTTCTAWDPVRDLALLQIVAAQGTPDAPFPCITVAETEPKPNVRLLCIGQPGSEDLEAAEAGQATGYDVLYVSHGLYRGVAADQDPQDNSEIGALMHDCWTYWGHSGAPLIRKSDGKLVGLHSSWDDQTGMRRGVHLVAIRAFLVEHAKEAM